MTKKTNTIRVRLSDEELAEFRAVAAREQRTVSSLLRVLVRQAAKQEPR